jgi:hypothetical protein
MSKKSEKSLTQTLAELYVQQMSAKEKQAYEIAKSHLGCTFDLEKSDGFLNFKKQQEKEPK